MKGTLTEPLIGPATSPDFSEEAVTTKAGGLKHESTSSSHGHHHHLPSKDYEVSLLKIQYVLLEKCISLISLAFQTCGKKNIMLLKVKQNVKNFLCRVWTMTSATMFLTRRVYVATQEW